MMSVNGAPGLINQAKGTVGARMSTCLCRMHAAVCAHAGISSLIARANYVTRGK